MEENIIIEGIVTKVNLFYGYFQVENTKIYMNLLKVLPKENEQIKLNTKIKNDSKLILIANNKTMLSGNFDLNIESNSFTDLITENSNETDVLELAKIVDLIEENFHFDSAEREMNIILLIIQSVVINNKLIREYNGLSCISKYRSVYIETDEFKEFPKWTHGIKRNNSLLFGSLTIDKIRGYFIFYDKNYSIRCEFIKNDNNSNILIELNNSYVILKKYILVSEIFNQKDIGNLEYLLIDSDDVFVVDYGDIKENLFGSSSLTKNKDQMDQIMAETLEESGTLEFVLLKKTPVIFNTRITGGQIVSYLLIRSTTNKENYYLTLPAFCIRIYPLFKEGFKYKLFYQKSLNIVERTPDLLVRLKNTLKVSTHFTLLEENYPYFEQMEFDFDPYSEIFDIDRSIQTSEIITMRGFVRNRNFVKKYPSAVKLQTNLEHFSTPGDETHVIFLTKENFGEDLSLYLRDWTNMVNPVGYIPHMEIILKNVLKDKPKVITLTPFTTFEVVNYKPKVPFQTANLYGNYKEDWGPHYFFGLGEHIPHGVIIWAKIHKFCILDISKYFICNHCNCLYPCKKHTNFDDYELDFRIKIEANDEYGRCLISCNNEKILQFLFNFSETDFSTFLKAFKSLGVYSYDKEEERDTEECNNMNSKKAFKKKLNDFFESFCQQSPFVHIKARKLYDNMPCENRWYYLDGRKADIEIN